MRLIFVNRFYWPEEPATAQLLTDLAESLAARGWNVTVVTSRPKTGDIPASELKNGVRVVRLSGPRWGDKSLLGRLMDFIAFAIGVQLWLLKNLGHQDLLIAKTDPPMLGTCVWPVVSIKRASLLHWVQDIYPEVAIALSSSPLTKLALRLFRVPRNLSWRRSKGCITLSDDMAAVIEKAGVPRSRITIIPNWAPAKLQPAAKADIESWKEAWGLEGRFIVQYSGNLGRVHDLEPIITIAAKLKTHNDITFVFVGNGAQRTRLEILARELRLDNIRFLPPQPRERLSISLSAGDLHIVTLHPDCAGCVFPSKLYGITAAGRPLIFIGPKQSSIAHLIREKRIGLTYAREETEAIAVEIVNCMNDKMSQKELSTSALRFGSTEGSLKCSIQEWDRRLHQIQRPTNANTA